MANLLHFFRSISFGADQLYFSLYCPENFVIQKLGLVNARRLLVAFTVKLAEIWAGF